METFFYYAGITSAAALGLLALVWAATALARAWRRRDPRLREVRQAQALRLRRLEEARAMGQPEMDEQEKRRRRKDRDDYWHERHRRRRHEWHRRHSLTAREVCWGKGEI